MKLNEYLTISEAADVLGIHVQTLRNWERLGKIKSFRHPISKFRLFKREDLQELLDSMQIINAE